MKVDISLEMRCILSCPLPKSCAQTVIKLLNGCSICGRLDVSRSVYDAAAIATDGRRYSNIPSSRRGASTEFSGALRMETSKTGLTSSQDKSENGGERGAKTRQKYLALPGFEDYCDCKRVRLYLLELELLSFWATRLPCRLPRHPSSSLSADRQSRVSPPRLPLTTPRCHRRPRPHHRLDRLGPATAHFPSSTRRQVLQVVKG